mmetsp:Transcript_36273/g.61172  ORF Transcript_36273/g.61172 Transcript_36273/m.61172 type:complete len:205 (+) Transcript_36273:501-1115(+)
MALFSPFSFCFSMPSAFSASSKKSLGSSLDFSLDFSFPFVLFSFGVNLSFVLVLAFSVAASAFSRRRISALSTIAPAAPSSSSSEADDAYNALGGGDGGGAVASSEMQSAAASARSFFASNSSSAFVLAAMAAATVFCCFVEGVGVGSSFFCGFAASSSLRFSSRLAEAGALAWICWCASERGSFCFRASPPSLDCGSFAASGV